LREILLQNNIDLLHSLAKVERSLDLIRPSVAPELRDYLVWIDSFITGIQERVKKNIRLIKLDLDSILEHILTRTQTATRDFFLLNQRLLAPILRSNSSDKLPLRLIRWLHKNHPTTKNVPFALSDGEFAVWPDPPQPAIYFLPPSAQGGFLYLSLFYHEFGHVLYAIHKPELDDLVRELQGEIEELLRPATSRNDFSSEQDDKKRIDIVETWYEWAQEIFCDAVALAIGGGSFVNAFGLYMRMRGLEEFHVPSHDLSGRSHPVTLIRVRLLSSLAVKKGWKSEANRLEESWNALAIARKVEEDYYGYYDQTFLPKVQDRIEDMMTVVEALVYEKKEDEKVEGAELLKCSPPVILNAAWTRFFVDPIGYAKWEDEMIDLINKSSEIWND
jgi:hypothetical protein